VKLKKSGEILYVHSWTEPEERYRRQEVYFEEGGWAYAYEVEIYTSKLHKALK
jgi:hypothetical protein